MRIDNPYLVGKMFKNMSQDSVRSDRTCPANLGVWSCPVEPYQTPKLERCVHASRLEMQPNGLGLTLVIIVKQHNQVAIGVKSGSFLFVFTNLWLRSNYANRSFFMLLEPLIFRRSTIRDVYHLLARKNVLKSTQNM